MKKGITSLAFVGVIALGTPFSLRFPHTATDTPRMNIRMDRNATDQGKLRAGSLRAILNGQVTTVGSSMVTVNNNGTSVQVDITSTTHIRRKFDGASNLGEISVGDTVYVVGKWTSDAKTEITAVTIRDMSIQKKNGTFYGKVTSLTSGGFVVDTIHRDSETVTLSSSTAITGRGGATLSQSSIQVGDEIRVTGMWDSNLKTITEVTKVRDFSQPPKASPSPTP